MPEQPYEEKDDTAGPAAKRAIGTVAREGRPTPETRTGEPMDRTLSRRIARSHGIPTDLDLRLDSLRFPAAKATLERALADAEGDVGTGWRRVRDLVERLPKDEYASGKEVRQALARLAGEDVR
ncbi:MAG TPA: hypothetical protein VM889_09690 [Candidatus Thermoplasmatota archaeon]|nr:hypothetical protein [Candidatus Thermoplasmatota archaeon]